MLRLDLIIRTSKRKRDARSPQQQRDMAQSCADVNGYRIVFTHDSGTDESGKTMRRASIDAAMARVRDGETDGVIVALADRIGRAPIEEAMTTVRAFCSAGKLVLADMGGQPLDLSNGVEESNVVFQLQMARQFWLNTANRFMRSQRDALDAGKFIGPTPLGYQRRAGKLIEHPQLAPIVREAYRRAARDGLAAAVVYLAERVPERARRRRVDGVAVEVVEPCHWNTDTVRKLLASRVYLGEAWIWVAGAHGDAGKERLVKPSAHPKLTTLDDWTAAQSAPRPRRANGGYLLSGIAECGECGAGLHGQLQTVNGRSYPRYRCSNRACRGGSSISAQRLDGYVRGALIAEARQIEASGPNGWRLRFVPGDVDAARAELETRESDLATFLQTVRPSAPGYANAYAALESSLDVAKRAHADLATQAAHCEQIPAVDELHIDEQILRGLRLARTRIVVRRGRGSLDARVDVSFWNVNALDNRAGIAAA